MRYEVRLSAYDVMDQVWVTVTLHSQQEVAEGIGEPVMQLSTTLDGTGESDPFDWVRDVLVGALELL